MAASESARDRPDHGAIFNPTTRTNPSGTLRSPPSFAL
jgi:hypothetical protein